MCGRTTPPPPGAPQTACSAERKGACGALPNIIYDDGNDRWQLRRRNSDGREVLIHLNCVSDATANTSKGTFHWH